MALGPSSSFFIREKHDGIVSETTRFALSLPPLRGGPLPFTSPRAAMVSDTDTPKSSVYRDKWCKRGLTPIVSFWRWHRRVPVVTVVTVENKITSSKKCTLLSSHQISSFISILISVLNSRTYMKSVIANSMCSNRLWKALVRGIFLVNSRSRPSFQ